MDASAPTTDDESIAVSIVAEANVNGGGVGVDGSTGAGSVAGESIGVSMLFVGTGKLTFVTVGNSRKTLVVAVVVATLVSVLIASDEASGSTILACVPAELATGAG